jgi:hypothetical protein
MSIRALGFGVSLALTVAAFLPAASPVVAADVHACTGAEAPEIAAPINRFAQVFCTSHGQMIAGHDGWLWIEPQQQALVVIPSGDMDENDAREIAKNTKVSAKSSPKQMAHFTKIDVTKIKGEEYDHAMANFRGVFDRTEGKPAGYKVGLTTAAGEDLQLYFFDYFTYGWGISCPGGQCDLSSRFVIVNMKHEPQKLQAPI